MNQRENFTRGIRDKIRGRDNRGARSRRSNVLPYRRVTTPPFV